MDSRPGNNLRKVIGEGKPVYLWSRQPRPRPKTARPLQTKLVVPRRGTEKKGRAQNGVPDTIEHLSESRKERERLLVTLEKGLIKSSSFHPKLQSTINKNTSNRKTEYQPGAGTSGVHVPKEERLQPTLYETRSEPLDNVKENTLITEFQIDFNRDDDDGRENCAINDYRGALQDGQRTCERDTPRQKERTRGGCHTNNRVHASDNDDSSVGSSIESISGADSYPHDNENSKLHRLPQRKSVDGKLRRTPVTRRGSDNEIDTVGYSGSSTSEADDIMTQQQRVDKRCASGRAHTRPSSARAPLEHHYAHRKDVVIDDMRRDLHRRLQSRKYRSVTGDDIFQRQLKSSFWTSEVLYHQWGNDLLTMRSTWKENGSREFMHASTEDEDHPPVRLRTRRQAISVERNKRSPLTMTTMSFMPDMPEMGGQIEDTARTLDARRRSSNPPLKKDRSYSVDDGLPVRLDVIESEYSKRRRLRALFKGTILKVMRITKVMLRMVAASKASTYSGLMASLHFSAVNEDEDPKKFNKDHYSRKYAELHVPMWAKQIAAKEPWERTPEEIIRLYGIMRNMRSFEKFTRRMRMEICRAARYNECSKGRVIVRQGHVGYNFYFIFSGSVFVQVDVLDTASGITTTNNVNTMGRGTCFGELALLGNGHRTASVICKELTELFEIEKEIFLEVCPDIFDNELTEKLRVANELSFFQQWPEPDLRRLCFESPIQEIDFGKVVETDPGSSEFCLVVLQGKVTLLKMCNVIKALTNQSKADTSKEGLFAALDSKEDLEDDGELAEGDAEKLKSLLLDEWTQSGKCHMRIGSMTTGHSTDYLPLRYRDREFLEDITLVSRGCRLMRIEKSRIEKLAPVEILETFRTKHPTVLPTPTNEELFERFLADLSWRHFRTYVTDGSLAKKTEGAATSQRSTSLKNYQVTHALLKTTRGRLSLKAKLREIWEKHRKSLQVEDEEDEDEDDEEDERRMVYMSKLRKGELPPAFSKIGDTLVL